MSNSGYFPVVVGGINRSDYIQTMSEAFQKPFFFGGSQVPVNIGLKPNTYSGSGFSSFRPMNFGKKKGSSIHINRVGNMINKPYSPKF